MGGSVMGGVGQREGRDSSLANNERNVIYGDCTLLSLVVPFLSYIVCSTQIYHREGRSAKSSSSVGDAEGKMIKKTMDIVRTVPLEHAIPSIYKMLCSFCVSLGRKVATEVKQHGDMAVCGGLCETLRLALGYIASGLEFIVTFIDADVMREVMMQVSEIVHSDCLEVLLDVLGLGGLNKGTSLEMLVRLRQCVFKTCAVNISVLTKLLVKITKSYVVSDMPIDASSGGDEEPPGLLMASHGPLLEQVFSQVNSSLKMVRQGKVNGSFSSQWPISELIEDSFKWLIFAYADLLSTLSSIILRVSVEKEVFFIFKLFESCSGFAKELMVEFGKENLNPNVWCIMERFVVSCQFVRCALSYYQIHLEDISHHGLKEFLSDCMSDEANGKHLTSNLDLLTTWSREEKRCQSMNIHCHSAEILGASMLTSFVNTVYTQTESSFLGKRIPFGTRWDEGLFSVLVGPIGCSRLLPEAKQRRLLASTDTSKKAFGTSGTQFLCQYISDITNKSSRENASWDFQVDVYLLPVLLNSLNFVESPLKAEALLETAVQLGARSASMSMPYTNIDYTLIPLLRFISGLYACGGDARQKAFSLMSSLWRKLSSIGEQADSAALRHMFGGTTTTGSTPSELVLVRLGGWLNESLSGRHPGEVHSVQLKSWEVVKAVCDSDPYWKGKDFAPLIMKAFVYYMKNNEPSTKSAPYSLSNLSECRALVIQLVIQLCLEGVIDFESICQFLFDAHDVSQKKKSGYLGAKAVEDMMFDAVESGRCVDKELQTMVELMSLAQHLAPVHPEILDEYEGLFPDRPEAAGGHYKGDSFKIKNSSERLVRQLNRTTWKLKAVSYLQKVIRKHSSQTVDSFVNVARRDTVTKALRAFYGFYNHIEEDLLQVVDFDKAVCILRDVINDLPANEYSKQPLKEHVQERDMERVDIGLYERMLGKHCFMDRTQFNKKLVSDLSDKDIGSPILTDVLCGELQHSPLFRSEIVKMTKNTKHDRISVDETGSAGNLKEESLVKTIDEMSVFLKTEEVATTRPGMKTGISVGVLLSHPIPSDDDKDYVIEFKRVLKQFCVKSPLLIAPNDWFFCFIVAQAWESFVFRYVTHMARKCCEDEGTGFGLGLNGVRDEIMAICDEVLVWSRGSFAVMSNCVLVLTSFANALRHVTLYVLPSLWAADVEANYGKLCVYSTELSSMVVDGLATLLGFERKSSFSPDHWTNTARKEKDSCGSSFDDVRLVSVVALLNVMQRLSFSIKGNSGTTNVGESGGMSVAMKTVEEASNVLLYASKTIGANDCHSSNLLFVAGYAAIKVVCNEYTLKPTTNCASNIKAVVCDVLNSVTKDLGKVQEKNYTFLRGELVALTNVASIFAQFSQRKDLEEIFAQVYEAHSLLIDHGKDLSLLAHVRLVCCRFAYHIQPNSKMADNIESVIKSCSEAEPLDMECQMGLGLLFLSLTPESEVEASSKPQLLSVKWLKGQMEQWNEYIIAAMGTNVKSRTQKTRKPALVSTQQANILVAALNTMTCLFGTDNANEATTKHAYKGLCGEIVVVCGPRKDILFNPQLIGNATVLLCNVKRLLTSIVRGDSRMFEDEMDAHKIARHCSALLGCLGFVFQANEFGSNMHNTVGGGAVNFSYLPSARILNSLQEALDLLLLEIEESNQKTANLAKLRKRVGVLLVELAAFFEQMAGNKMLMINYTFIMGRIVRLCSIENPGFEQNQANTTVDLRLSADVEFAVVKLLFAAKDYISNFADVVERLFISKSPCDKSTFGEADAYIYGYQCQPFLKMEVTTQEFVLKHLDVLISSTPQSPVGGNFLSGILRYSFAKLYFNSNESYFATDPFSCALQSGIDSLCEMGLGQGPENTSRSSPVMAQASHKRFCESIRVVVEVALRSCFQLSIEAFYKTDEQLVDRAFALQCIFKWIMSLVSVFIPARCLPALIANLKEQTNARGVDVAIAQVTYFWAAGMCNRRATTKNKLCSSDVEICSAVCRDGIVEMCGGVINGSSLPSSSKESERTNERRLLIESGILVTDIWDALRSFSGTIGNEENRLVFQCDWILKLLDSLCVILSAHSMENIGMNVSLVDHFIFFLSLSCLGLCSGRNMDALIHAPNQSYHLLSASFNQSFACFMASHHPHATDKGKMIVRTCYSLLELLETRARHVTLMLREGEARNGNNRASAGSAEDVYILNESANICVTQYKLFLYTMMEVRSWCMNVCESSSSIPPEDAQTWYFMETSSAHLLVPSSILYL
eukprot:Nk52_evm7s246 gene=Nk52_evmTU7s246